MSIETQERARQLVLRLGGHWHGHYGLCRCPAHADTRPSLRIAGGQTNILVHCFAGCRRGEILRALRDFETGPSPSNPSAIAEPRPTISLWTMQRIWGEGRAVEGTCAETYLRRRGIAGRSPALRFHPRLFAGPRKNGVSFPGLMAAISNDEGLIAIQRTFLSPDGQKAPIDGPRRTIGSPGIGAVRLSEPRNGVLGLAEGTETALSAQALFDIPTWATCGTENFAKVAIPESVSDLWLFLDNGRGGDRAECLVHERTSLQARIHVRRPPHDFGDWNDVHLAGERERRAGKGRAAGQVTGRKQETHPWRSNSSPSAS